MAATWPASLQQKLSEANFGIDKGATALRSDMAYGPQKVRRRFTKGIDSYSASIWLTAEQYTFFENFYDTTLNGGVLTFNFNHPITQVLTEFKFKSEPKYSSIGGNNYTVAFEWEVVP